MFRQTMLSAACLSLLVVVWLAGCGPTANPPPAPPVTGGPEKGHDEHGPEHSHDGEKGHSHPEKGPRGGVLIGFGHEDAHLELLFDSKEGKLTAYPLDGHAEKAVEVGQDQIELSFTARKDPQAEELPEPKLLTLKKVAGDPVKFVGQSDDLKGLEKWDGSFSAVKLAGEEFKETQFKYPEGNHDHH